jgi:hypothetical protein
VNRKTILQVPLILLAALITATLALVFWLIMLIPMLIHPSIIKPITTRVSHQFSKQMMSYIMGGKKSTPPQSQPSPALLLPFSARSQESSQRFDPRTQQPLHKDWPPEHKAPPTTPSSK